MKRKIGIPLVLLIALSFVCSSLLFTSAQPTYGTPSTHEPRDHKATTDPCKDAGNCGPGDHGQGDPTKAVPNCNATQGEPDVCKTKAPKATDVPQATDVPKATSTSVPKATATHVPQATPTSVPQSTPTDVPQSTPRATATPNDPPPAVTSTPKWNPTDTPQTYVTPVARPLLKYTPSTGSCAIQCGCLASIVVTETWTTWASGITQTLRVTTYTYESSSGQ